MRSRIQRSAVVPYTAEQMFDLVNDVPAYPEFLPFCRAAAVLTQSSHEIKARLELAKGALHKSFTTRNQLDPPRRIEMHLLDGPFKRLHGTWSFAREGERRTRVALDLEFEFSNRLMGLALGPVFHQLANSMVDAFVQRAQVLYGLSHA